MSKRNITFSRPAEPSFLRKLKEQAGYKEGPTVDTKREDLGAVRPEDFEDTNEELPTVVVLKPGDLTAEEADTYKAQLEKEENEKPADLTAPIIFKAREKPNNKPLETDAQEEPPKKKQKKVKKTTNKQLLSFNDNDDAEEEDN
ncbi:uncharacterized protein KIAA1143 homolog [Atheta coriaria]|uniref:uncharacterized protein KIAA1143 homolog n=1 Tax=Dalotia coriaria TaxID=877792 RepID=UPI0031F452C5